MSDRRLDGRPADRPLVLVVDDAHLGDAPSLDALTFVTRRLLADAVAVVVTARTSGIDASHPGSSAWRGRPVGWWSSVRSRSRRWGS